MPFINISRSSILSVIAPLSNLWMRLLSVWRWQSWRRDSHVCQSGSNPRISSCWSLELEVVRDTHELNAISRQLLLQPSPIVARLDVVLLIVDSRTMSVAENHHLLFFSSQTARTSRSLKKRIDFLLISRSFFITFLFVVLLLFLTSSVCL